MRPAKLRTAIAFFLVTVTLWVALPGRMAFASVVLPPGKEQVVLDLFAPHKLGSELGSGWRMENVAIKARHVEVLAVNVQGDQALMTLRQRDVGASADIRTPSFDIVSMAKGDRGAAALGVLRGALATNDDGTFWDAHGVPVSATFRRSSPRPALQDDKRPQHETSRPYASDPMTRPAVQDDTRPQHETSRPYSSAPLTLDRLGTWAGSVLGDGVTHLASLLLILIALTLLATRRSPDWVRMALVGVVAVGAALRIALAPRVGLAVWPYSRIIRPVRRIFEGSTYEAMLGGPVDLVDLGFEVNLIYACLATVAMFVHARYLLGDDRRALVAAGILATLPLHIRFSASDVAFIPSITLSATTFALIHASTREANRWVRTTSLCLLGGLLVLVYEARPLNIMYGPLLLGACLLPGRQPMRRRWVWAASVVVAGVTLAIGVPELLADYGQDVRDGLDVDVLKTALSVVFSPSHNILANPSYSPPAHLLAGVAGFVWMYRGKERLRAAFLLLWIGLFLVAHAYVVPDSVANQARYHLHLIAPYILLASVGWVRLTESRPRWTLPAVVLVLASPLLHHTAMLDTNFNDQREHLFLQRVRPAVPEGCTVLEFAHVVHNARFLRMGTYRQDGATRSRFKVEVAVVVDSHGEGTLGRKIYEEVNPQARPAGVGAPPEGSGLSPRVRKTLASPPQCLFVYQGLPCFGIKHPKQDIHPTCRALTAGLDLELIASEDVTAPPYDGFYRHGLSEGVPESVPLRLWRVRSRKAESNPAP